MVNVKVVFELCDLEMVSLGQRLCQMLDMTYTVQNLGPLGTLVICIVRSCTPRSTHGTPQRHDLRLELTNSLSHIDGR